MKRSHAVLAAKTQPAKKKKAVSETTPATEETDSIETLIAKRKTLLAEQAQLKKRGHRKLSKEQKQQLTHIPEQVQTLRLAIAETARKTGESMPDTEASGMTHQHSLTLSKFAAANDVIVIWRPINKNAAGRLDRAINPYMGKGLNTKGKSSEFGPIAGDIPLEAGLSKVAITDTDHIPKFNTKNQEALQKDQEKYETIKDKITDKNIGEMNDLLLVTSVNKKTSDGKTIYFFADENNNIVWNDQTNMPVFAI